MIQYKKGTYRLNSLIPNSAEYGKSSIFKLIVPDELSIGRNEIKIKVKPDILLKDSEILIDIFDSTQSPIYYQIPRIANDDFSRSIIVFIYPNTPTGKATLYISGTYISGESYLFSTNIIVTSNKNKQEIKFDVEPKVQYTERLEAIRVFNTQRTITNRFSRNQQSISLVSINSPKNIDRDNLSVEKPEISNRLETNQISSNIGISDSLEIPKFFDNSILTGKNLEFSSSMKGGMIYVNDLSLPAPSDAILTSSFNGFSYSASIVSVLNTSSIEVFPPFRKTIDYLTKDSANKSITFDRFYNHTNFTTSFYDLVSVSSSTTTQSFAILDLYDIEPIAGNLKSIEVSYKPINQFGSNFQPIGKFQVQSRNILVDSGSIFFDNDLGLVENPIGFFRNGISDFQLNWTTQSFGTGSISTAQSSRLKDGIRISYRSTRSLADYTIFKPKKTYFANRNTEFELKFNTIAETDYSHSLANLDIFISGSSIKIDSELNLGSEPIFRSSSFGTYLGSINQKYGADQKNLFNFVNVESNYIQPIFVIRTGVWNFSNIELISRSEPGFSPNQSRVYVPLDNVRGKSELSLKIQYLDELDTPSNYQTILDKVYFKGLDDSISKTIITNGSSSKQTYITNQVEDLIGPTTFVDILFPIYRNEINQIYTGSMQTVGMIFQIETMIMGISGSLQSADNSYVWACTSQGRSGVTSTENSGTPFIYNSIHVSGSNLNTIGTFGTGGVSTPIKTNLDSWFRVNSLSVQNDSIRVRYEVSPTGSQTWVGHISSTCQVTKYDIQY